MSVGISLYIFPQKMIKKCFGLRPGFPSSPKTLYTPQQLTAHTGTPASEKPGELSFFSLSSLCLSVPHVSHSVSPFLSPAASHFLSHTFLHYLRQR